MAWGGQVLSSTFLRDEVGTIKYQDPENFLNVAAWEKYVYFEELGFL